MRLDREVALNGAANPPSLAACEERMMDLRRLSIELSEEMAEIVDARIASGRNASETEVIQEAMELLAEQDREQEDPELEAWLRGEVVPAYEKWKSGGEKGLTADEVRASLARRRSARHSDAAE